MCPRCEGRGSVTDFDLSALYDDGKSLNEGALTIPGYSMDGWFGRIFLGCGFNPFFFRAGFFLGGSTHFGDLCIQSGKP